MTSPRPWVWGAALALLCLTGCNPTNTACEKYVENVNSLPCMTLPEARLNADFCIQFRDYKATCNRSKYFTCLEQGFTCAGDRLQVDTRACQLEECPAGQGESNNDSLAD